MGLVTSNFSGLKKLAWLFLDNVGCVLSNLVWNLFPVLFRRDCAFLARRTGAYDSCTKMAYMMRSIPSNAETIQKIQGQPMCCETDPPTIGPTAAPSNGASWTKLKDLPRFSALQISATEGLASYDMTRQHCRPDEIQIMRNLVCRLTAMLTLPPHPDRKRPAIISPFDLLTGHNAFQRMYHRWARMYAGLRPYISENDAMSNGPKTKAKR